MSGTQSKRKTVAFRILSILLGVAFIVFGGGKFAGGQQVVDNFAKWGYPAWFRWFTGGVELAAGILILIPKTRFYGAALAAGTMVGAVLTHVRAGEYPQVVLPLVLGTLAAVLAWTHRPTWLLRGGASATPPAA
ncbi:MAG TPA: DoxX family protein [Myxococcaceae bacterium]|nr:DoxX family protein [Myxococcaceae bacterium]